MKVTVFQTCHYGETLSEYRTHKHTNSRAQSHCVCDEFLSVGGSKSRRQPLSTLSHKNKEKHKRKTGLEGHKEVILKTE